eukprot:COSAG05_NODE_6577_length_935_cov_3691.218900_1_plen_115_part_00
MEPQPRRPQPRPRPEPVSKVEVGSRYYVFNLLSELDSDGEFFLSRDGETRGMLYLQPPKGTWPPAPGSSVLAGAYVSSAVNLVVLQAGARTVICDTYNSATLGSDSLVSPLVFA